MVPFRRRYERLPPLSAPNITSRPLPDVLFLMKTLP
jgi:hypothetical protein